MDAVNLEQRLLDRVVNLKVPTELTDTNVVNPEEPIFVTNELVVDKRMTETQLEDETEAEAKKIFSKTSDSASDGLEQFLVENVKSRIESKMRKAEELGSLMEGLDKLTIGERVSVSSLILSN